MSKSQTSPLDKHEETIAKLVKEGKTNPEIVKELKGKGIKSSESSIRRAIKRWGITRPAQIKKTEEFIEHENGSVSITAILSKAEAGDITPEDLMRHYGCDPEDYYHSGVKMGIWGNADRPNFSMKLDAFPKSLIVLPDDDFEFSDPPKYIKPDKDEALRWMFITDPHVPLNDKGMHECILSFVKDYKPHLIIFGGDTGDFTSISRHRKNPGRLQQSMQDCINAGGQYFRDFRKAAPNTEMILLEGNHDFRVKSAIMDNNAEFYGVTPFEEEVPMIDLRRYWKLDQVHVKMVPEDWDIAHTFIGENLLVEHGTNTSKNACNNLLDKMSMSVMFGHTHRAAMVFKTEHDKFNRTYNTRVAINGGTTAQIIDGAGYAKEPNWQQVITYGTLWEDNDTFAAAFAMFVDDTLLVPDGKRYKATVDTYGEPL